MIVLRNKEDSHKQVSEHFKGNELTCKCGKCHISIIDKQNLLLLETMRKIWGLPIKPSSFYRCQEHNRSLPNSAPLSKHCSGKAVDLPLPDDEYQRDSFIAMAEAIWPWTYVGNGFIHCDVRD